MIPEKRLKEMETEARNAMMGSALSEYVPDEFFELLEEVKLLRKVAECMGVCVTALLQSSLEKKDRDKLLDMMSGPYTNWKTTRVGRS